VELIFGVVGHRKREPCQVVIADFGLAIEPGQLNQSRLGKNAEKLAATTYLKVKYRFRQGPLSLRPLLRLLKVCNCICISICFCICPNIITAFVAGSAGGQQAVATGSTSGVLPAVPAIRCGGPAGRYK